MSNADLSDSGSLTPPLADIEKEWQHFGDDDDLINIDTELSPKRQKLGYIEAESMLHHVCYLFYAVWEEGVNLAGCGVTYCRVD